MSSIFRPLTISLLVLALLLACSPTSGRTLPGTGTPLENEVATPTPNQGGNAVIEATPTAALVDTPTSVPPPTPTLAPSRPTPSSVPPSSAADAKEIVRGPTTGNMVALTFDAGSAAGPSSRILDILKENNIRVTMFVTGKFVDTYPDIVRRMAQDGHQISNHSYTHSDFTTLSDQQTIDEMDKTDQAILRVTGKSSKPYMRMPFGARNSRVLGTVSSAGYRSIYWTLDSGDWLENATANSVRQRILQNVASGYIVVQHMNSEQTATSLKDVISGIKEKGLRIVSLSEMLGGTAKANTVTIGLLTHVNKNKSLPTDYTPPGLVQISGVSVTRQGMVLRDVALEPLKEMLTAAGKLGLDLVVLSAYRSYSEQQQIYGQEVAQSGEAQASRLVALPGHSEHQLGTTIDITSPSIAYSLSQSFQNTSEGIWLGENAHRFGFVMSYPDGKEHITGYAYEPWHFRYIGIEAATEIKQLGITLEEYLRDSYAN